MSTRAAMLMFGPQCCWCGECFSRSSSLARHITTPHTFPCNHCQMKFTLKTNLGKHKAACPNKQSSDSSLLKRKSLSLSHTEKKKIKFHAKVKLEDLGSNNNGEETTVSPAPMEEFIDISIGVFGVASKLVHRTALTVWGNFCIPCFAENGLFWHWLMIMILILVDGVATWK